MRDSIAKRRGWGRRVRMVRGTVRTKNRPRGVSAAGVPVRRMLVAALVVGAAGAGEVRGQAVDPVAAERVAAREWFRDAKFGMFIHWGVYSQLGRGEWVMENARIPVGRYEWLASAFNPVKFDARAWVTLARNAGMRYITITARHHDGFSMFASEATRYDIMDWTSFGRDPLKELAAECQRQGIRLFFYYSQLDWRHTDYWPRGRTGQNTGRPESGDWDGYLDFMDQQLTELLTAYGPLGGIWLDGMWDRPAADWRLEQTYSLIHRLQPGALIVPNHHESPRPGEDVQTFEQDLPGANTAGFNTTTISALPLETSLTMNGTWGFDITDTDFKSTRALIAYLVRAAGNGANLLLNIGPRPDGTIQPEFVSRLEEIGRWLTVHGASIHGTRAGPVSPRDWGATTRRGDTVFVHILDWPDRVLSLPTFGARVQSATMLDNGESVAVAQTAEAITLTLPVRPAAVPDRVVVLRTSPAAGERRSAALPPGGSLLEKRRNAFAEVAAAVDETQQVFIGRQAGRAQAVYRALGRLQCERCIGSDLVDQFGDACIQSVRIDDLGQEPGIECIIGSDEAGREEQGRGACGSEVSHEPCGIGNGEAVADRSGDGHAEATVRCGHAEIACGGHHQTGTDGIAFNDGDGGETQRFESRDDLFESLFIGEAVIL